MSESNAEYVKVSDLIEFIEGMDATRMPDLSDAEVVGEAIKKYGHSLQDMDVDLDEVANEDWVAENVDLDRVMGVHSCGELTEKLVEYHGESDVMSEMESVMGKSDWREFIAREAVDSLGYSDQADLVTKLLKQNDGGRIEDALKENGWIKQSDLPPAQPWSEDDRESDKARIAVETITANYLIDALMKRYSYGNVLAMIKAWGVEDGQDAFKEIRAEVEAEVKKKMAERIMACLFGV